MARTQKQSGAGSKKEKVRSRIRSVGNSKEVILNNQLLKAAGISIEEDISIEAGVGVITISQAKPDVNTDLSTWDTQFKKAIKSGHLPEGDLFEGLEDEYDKTEW